MWWKLNRLLRMTRFPRHLSAGVAVGLSATDNAGGLGVNDLEPVDNKTFLKACVFNNTIYLTWWHRFVDGASIHRV